MADGICPNCRRPLPENARFCSECGSRIDILVTRKELGAASSEDGGGLKINRKEPISSPFCSSYNNLRDKILNPNLAPLLEKKKFVFKSWEDIKIGSGEQATIQEEEEVVAQSRVEQQIDGRESVDQTENLEKTVIVVAVKESEDKNSSATDMGEKSENEESGIGSGQSGEEPFVVELQDNPTDFEAMKELFAEALSNGETDGEKREAEEAVENSDYEVDQDCNETLEGIDAFSGGMTSGAADECDKVSFEEICPEYQRGESNLKDVTGVTDEQSEDDEERDVDETIIGITETEAEEHLAALQKEPTDFDALNVLLSENIAVDADGRECSKNIESYDYEESTVIQESAGEPCESIEKNEDAPEIHTRGSVDEIRITEMERDSSGHTEEKHQTVAEASADTETATEKTVIELQESVTDFESLKEMFVENSSESEDELFEKDNDLESVERAIQAENLIETARDGTESDGKYQSNTVTQTESVGQDEEETAVELREDTTELEALKGLFSGNSEEVEGGVLEHCTETEENPAQAEQLGFERHVGDPDNWEADAWGADVYEFIENISGNLTETQRDVSAISDMADESVEAQNGVSNQREGNQSIETIVTEVSESVEKLPKVPSEKISDMDSSHSVDFAISDTENNELYSGALAESRENEQVMNFLADNIGERFQEQVAMEVTEKTFEQKPNRIITSTVGGGFRRKSPQAEQLKEISGLFWKKNRK